MDLKHVYSAWDRPCTWDILKASNRGLVCLRRHLSLSSGAWAPGQHLDHRLVKGSRAVRVLARFLDVPIVCLSLLIHLVLSLGFGMSSQ